MNFKYARKYFSQIRITPLFYLALIFIGCTSVPEKIADKIENSSNKKEIEKVVQHYKQLGDKAKLRALYFLIEHIDYHQHQEGSGVDHYHNIFEELKQTPEGKKEWLSTIYDSLITAKGYSYIGSTFPVRDINSLKSEEWIHHIDAAFLAWKQPWAKRLTFEAFSEYILPYKLLEENPGNWMATAQRSFSSLKLNSTDPYKVCLMINNELKRRFTIRTIPSFVDLNFEQLDAIRSGKCNHASQYTAYVMRSFGIPVTIDYAYWGNMNGTHTWNALIYNGKPIPFVGAESDPGKTKIDLARQRKRSKIFRYTYTIQKKELQYLTKNTEEIPNEFRNYYIQDVTEQYIPVSDVSIKIGKIEACKYYYLCIFNRQTWKPTYWATNENQVALFKNMGRDIVYLPTKLESQTLVGVAPPFLLRHDGTMETLKADLQHSKSIKITKKSPYGPAIVKGNEYELFYWNDGWQSLGTKVSEGNSIAFNQVPDNALLWIRSKDKSDKERPFLSKLDEQIWY